MTPRRLIPLFLLALLLCLSADDGIGVSSAVLDQLTPPQREEKQTISRCKGPFLRTEVRGKTSEFQLAAALALSHPHRQPVLQLKILEFQTLAEVRIYEAFLRTFIPGDNPGQGTIELRRLEGEVWEEETRPRTLLLEGGPLANTKVLLDGIPLATDEQGVVQDPENRLNLLARFDNLGTRRSQVSIQVEGYPELVFPLTRTMPQRAENDEKRLEEDEAGEILLAYGLDFRLSRRKPEQEALQCRLLLPKSMAFAVTGEAFPLTVEVTNRGSVQTSCLIARSFSRIPGLHGKLFYFGAIPPGKSASFTRLLTVENGEKTSKAYLEIRFSDSWGIPEHPLPLTLPLIHGTP